MSCKSKGINFERTVKQYLKKQGCLVVRQAASLFPDIVAITPTNTEVVIGNTTFHGTFILIVECKASKGKLSSTEQTAMLGLAKKYHATALYAMRGRTLKDIVWERIVSTQQI